MPKQKDHIMDENKEKPTITNKRNEELETMQRILDVVDRLDDDYKAHRCLRWCLEAVDLRRTASSGAGMLGGSIGMAQQFKP